MLLSHRRGSSVAPPASTTTLACSVTFSPVAPTRHVTPLATVPPPSSAVITFTTKASGTRVTAFPLVQRSAVRAMGT